MYCVYKLIDESGEVVYVGKTKKIDTRIKEHYINSHLERKANPKESVSKVFYVELNSLVDMDIIEKYLIAKYRPKYNSYLKGWGETNLDIKVPPFKEYGKYKDLKRIPLFTPPTMILETFKMRGFEYRARVKSGYFFKGNLHVGVSPIMDNGLFLVNFPDFDIQYKNGELILVNDKLERKEISRNDFLKKVKSYELKYQK